MDIGTSWTTADGLNLALDAVGHNQSKLARICGCTQGAIWQMMNKDCPALSVQYVLKVEAALGIPRSRLRPDIYPNDDAGLRAA